MWRPFCTPIMFWTPPNSDAGVQSTLLSSFGRHLPDYMASSLSVLSNLDAIRTITRRPILLTFSNWTPHTQSHGVQFCCSSQVGRHSTRTLASIPHSFPDLDASRTHCWRPFRTASPIWMPRQSTFGVQSTLSSPFGRLRHSPLASVLLSLSNLDASHIVTWRPFRTSSPIWTPLNSGDGVCSCCSP